MELIFCSSCVWGKGGAGINPCIRGQVFRGWAVKLRTSKQIKAFPYSSLMQKCSYSDFLRSSVLKMGGLLLLLRAKA